MLNYQHYPTFVVRNNPSFVKYVQRNWKYFLSPKRTSCKIVIRKSDIFIHTTQLYCIIFNDLKYIKANPDKYILEMDNKAKKLFDLYCSHH